MMEIYKTVEWERETKEITFNMLSAKKPDGCNECAFSMYCSQKDLGNTGHMLTLAINKRDLEGLKNQRSPCGMVDDGTMELAGNI